ncbi:hypothetical protein Hanom_Chr04g00280271 [Helianthus anomalus]
MICVGYLSSFSLRRRFNILPNHFLVGPVLNSLNLGSGFLLLGFFIFSGLDPFFLIDSLPENLTS